MTNINIYPDDGQAHHLEWVHFRAADGLVHVCMVTPGYAMPGYWYTWCSDMYYFVAENVTDAPVTCLGCHADR